MKYFFLLSEKFYRFIEWEWNILKNLRRTKRKNIFLRGSFALFSLFSILFLISSEGQSLGSCPRSAKISMSNQDALGQGPACSALAMDPKQMEVR